MTALKNPYCTLEDVQIETRNEDESEYELFQSCINAASRAIDEYCRRDFLFHDHSSSALVVPASWMAQNVLYLPFPCITITKVVIGDQELTSDEYVLERDPFTKSAKLIKSGRWLPGDAYRSDIVNGGRVFGLPQQVQLTGTFGYAPDPASATTLPSPDLPSEIRQACAIYAAVRSGRSTREFVGYNGQRETVTQRKIPSEVTAILDRWRIQLV